MNCNTTHYRANSSSVPGDPTLVDALGLFVGLWAAGKVAPVIKGMMAIAGGLDAIGVSATLMLARLGPVGAALAGLSALAALWWSQQPDFNKSTMAPTDPRWKDIPEQEQLQYPNSPTSLRSPSTFERWGHSLNRWLRGGAEPGSATGQEVIAGLEKRGLSHEDSIAVTANLQAESGSGFNPRAHNAGHVGIAQWDSTRQAHFRSLYGIDVQDATRDQQLDFVVWELRNTHKAAYDAMQRATTLDEKTAAIDRHYEMPGNYAVNDPVRQGYAHGYDRGIIADKQTSISPDVDAALRRLRAAPTTISPSPAAPSPAALPPVPPAPTAPPAIALPTIQVFPQQQSMQGIGAVLASMPPQYNPAQYSYSTTHHTTTHSISNDNSSETHVGNITINTAATDAQGLMRDLGAKLREYATIPRANVGLT